jgi:hypothetical protein
MIDKMRMGKMAVESGDVIEVIYANAGGPYGSEVLEIMSRAIKRFIDGPMEGHKTQKGHLNYRRRTKTVDLNHRRTQTVDLKITQLRTD